MSENAIVFIVALFRSWIDRICSILTELIPLSNNDKAFSVKMKVIRHRKTAIIWHTFLSNTVKFHRDEWRPVRGSEYVCVRVYNDTTNRVARESNEKPKQLNVNKSHWTYFDLLSLSLPAMTMVSTSWTLYVDSLHMLRPIIRTWIKKNTGWKYESTCIIQWNLLASFCRNRMWCWNTHSEYAFSFAFKNVDKQTVHYTLNNDNDDADVIINWIEYCTL